MYEAFCEILPRDLDPLQGGEPYRFQSLPRNNSHSSVPAEDMHVSFDGIELGVTVTPRPGQKN